ncbi:hypothetical protein DFH07DRAFT_58354 [Mycena maculata]|uniref:Uncharacterized protein n=1 Tax=Mycena maculata TaxID=230809 RepID=A0AAD7IET3_9AGAR|nr:hypothetical protein DFH07DRAFT_58354 [Mycena maculata]
MPSYSLLQSNYADHNPQLESDIADQHDQLNQDDQVDFPPRPNSRLGFNSTPATVEAPEPPVAPLRSRSGTLKWTKSLFQKIGITSLASSSVDVDMDITAAVITSPTDDEDIDPPSLPILPSLAPALASTSSLSSMDADTGESCDDEYDSDSEGYSSGDSDIDLDSPAEYGQGGRDLLVCPPTPTVPPPPPPPPPAVPPAPIAPFSVPSNAPLPPFARRPTAVSLSPPAVRTKYTCLPSPLSPTSDDSIHYTNPLRHLYGHHGRSRHALLHLKYLWSLRADQWDEHTARMRESYAYCGMTPPNTPQPPPRYPPPRRQTSPDLVPIPPMTIHPRRGDLSALRDPYCAHMDRCFVGMPLWTMGKTLWMYDVHMVAEGRARAAKAAEGGSEDDESEGESMAASISTAGFSDDSDETLVESESDRSVRSEDESLEEVDLDVDTQDVKFAVSPPCSRPPYKPPLVSASLPPAPHWETSWYKRWEILIELVRLDTERERAQRNGLDPSPPPCALAVRPPRFFIGDAEDENENEGDESWSEEQWDEVLGLDGAEDQVMIVSNQVLLEGM